MGTSSTHLRVHSHERRNELKPVWDFISVENLTLVFSQLFTYVHMNWGKMKLKPVWISYWSFWLKWNFKLVWDFHVHKIYQKENEEAQTHLILYLKCMCIWTSLRVLFHCSHLDRNEISLQVIKYHVNTTGNEMHTYSIEILGHFEMQTKWNFMWNELVFILVWNPKQLSSFHLSCKRTLGWFPF